ncbi:MAG: acetyl-CoA carboxylase carboxyl transferase subunit beta, partial [Ignavibacteria bacterium CG_4_8_14_3_um_filter_37_9]
MSWFKRSKKNFSDDTQKIDLPDGMWMKCPDCDEIIHKKQLENNFWTCVKCSYHFRIGSAEYIKVILDEGSFKEMNKK